MLYNKIAIAIILLLSVNVFAQKETKQVFPVSSDTKYKDFNSYMRFKGVCRTSAKITFIENTTTQNTIIKNECILIFDNKNCQHRRYNFFKKQDSLQYICDGYSLYTISHKTKEIIIEDAENGIELMKNNPFVYFYSYMGYFIYPSAKKKDVEMLVDKDFVMLNCFKSKTHVLYDVGYYSSKFRTCDFALSEQKCLLKNDKGITNLYNAMLISLENENVNNFTEKDFDANQWYDNNYTITDKRSVMTNIQKH